MRAQNCLLLSASCYHLRQQGLPPNVFYFEGLASGYELTDGGAFVVFEVNSDYLDEDQDG